MQTLRFNHEYTTPGSFQSFAIHFIASNSYLSLTHTIKITQCFFYFKRLRQVTMTDAIHAHLRVYQSFLHHIYDSLINHKEKEWILHYKLSLWHERELKAKQCKRTDIYALSTIVSYKPKLGFYLLSEKRFTRINLT